MRVSLKQSSRRVHQSPAEPIVPLLRSGRAGARCENLIYRLWAKRGIAFDQERRDAADMGGGNRSAGGELIAGIGSWFDNLDTRCGDCDVRALIGTAKQLVIAIACSNRDHIGIGRRIERR